MQFEYDPERLIEEVKKRPGIWDFEHVDYKAPAVRYQLWNEIVSQMLNPEMEVSKSEIRELELQIQKKWKSIRDCFVKCLSKPNQRKRPYIYSKKLSFLLKGAEPEGYTGQKIKMKSTEANDSSDSDGASKPKFGWKRRSIRRPRRYESSSDNNDTLDDGMTADDCAPPAMKIEKRNDDFAFASVDVVQSSYEPNGDDADKMFLLSLLPHLKSIPEAFRLNVKMELMQVLKSAHISTSQFKL